MSTLSALITRINALPLGTRFTFTIGGMDASKGYKQLTGVGQTLAALVESNRLCVEPDKQIITRMNIHGRTHTSEMNVYYAKQTIAAYTPPKQSSKDTFEDQLFGWRAVMPALFKYAYADNASM